MVCKQTLINLPLIFQVEKTLLFLFGFFTKKYWIPE